MENKADAYREIFYSCVEGIILVQHGKVVLANPQCEDLFGYGVDEMLGMKVEEFVPINKRGYHHEVRSEYTKHPVTKQMGVGRDLIALRKDGTTFPVEISLNPADINGEEAVIAHIIDISIRKKVEMDLKKSEEQLIQYAAELEQRVDERTKELADVVTDLKKTNIHLEAEIIERIKAENEAKKALNKEKELNEMKSRFVSMASHEFRTPLSTILSSASLIARYTNTEDQEKRDKHIKRIKTNVSELTSILNEFLSLEKIDAGKMHVEIKELALNEYLKEMVSDLETITKDGQTIKSQLPDSEVMIKSDPQLLKQIITNLMSNAIKYSDIGSEIQMNVSHNGEKIYLAIKDQGMGIPEGDQKHLFDKFFRAHNSHHIQGTGLGLNIVKKYLELLDGDITFESVEGKGSTFTIILNK
ncbi:PAS domain-containing sensor histidine kinase [Reichenbachiella ulvae]|uniref:histidine kinase n=1 Tax=Reichenbachiella ulvae TaxID=2980104 RepID=A0ABT3CRF2_9BACT|nr:PAS domain-containing sensor histidine kinase [Reichenbachiella ulvae]MCV9386247.1 PAS domain-containing sensor histidine kinase [Reichenbachiella ulvae]